MLGFDCKPFVPGTLLTLGMEVLAAINVWRCGPLWVILLAILVRVLPVLHYWPNTVAALGIIVTVAL